MANQCDPFLEKRVKAYDRWLQKKQIAYASKVIPVAESLDAQKWVLPSEQAIHILQSADVVAVQPCECRTHYHRCDRPTEVCLLLNKAADTAVTKGKARHIDLNGAADLLKLANTHGLVHLSLYMPDHQVYALCSCCTCCCHDLQLVQTHGRKDLMVHSEYTARTDHGLCGHCGICVDRCSFGARHIQNDALAFIAESCTGCGLCVTTCPSEAIAMECRK